jgi:hypothetical protein
MEGVEQKRDICWRTGGGLGEVRDQVGGEWERVEMERSSFCRRSWVERQESNRTAIRTRARAETTAMESKTESPEMIVISPRARATPALKAERSALRKRMPRVVTMTRGRAEVDG